MAGEIGVDGGAGADGGADGDGGGNWLLDLSVNITHCDCNNWTFEHFRSLYSSSEIST